MPRVLDRLRLRIRSLTHGRAADESLRHEIELHLQEQIDENIAAGMSPADARTAALRSFGSVALVEEQCRDTRRVALVETLVQDLKYSLRSLVHQPLLLVAAVTSIAVAIGANTSIFAIVDELLWAPPTARSPEQLVEMRMGGGSHVSYRQWRDLAESEALDGLAGYNFETSVNWRSGDQVVSLMPMVVTANFFDVIGPRFLMGRGFTAAEAQAERDPDLVVLTYRFWRERLGADPDVLGRSLTFNGRPFTVTGVLSSDFRSVAGFALSPEVYLPLGPSLAPDLDTLGAAAHVQLVGRLRRGQSLADGRAAIAAAGERAAPAYENKNLETVGQFTYVGGMQQFGSMATVAAFLAVLLVAGGSILAITCANVAGLLLSRLTSRSREMALRVALGATKRRLAQQLLAEGFWLALGGTVGGLLIMKVTIGALRRVQLPLPAPLEIHGDLTDSRLIAISVVLLIVTMGLCAVAPVLQATRKSPVTALKRLPTAGGRRWGLRNLLVVAQVAVALVLLLTAFLFLRNLELARSLNPGFDVAHTSVALISLVENRYTQAQRVVLLEDAVERLRSLPGVERAAYGRGAPLTLRSGMVTGARLVVEGGGRDFQAMYSNNFVGPGYFETMGIPFIKGRGFGKGDRRGAPSVIVINEEFARRYFAGADPIGVSIRLPGPTPDGYFAEIVGIVGDSKYRTLAEERSPAMYEPYAQRSNRDRVAHLFVRTAEGTSVAPRQIADVVGALDPSAAVDVKPMRSALAFAFLPSQIGAAILGTLGALGLLLAMVGLFAVVSYSVSRRVPEIGVRLALGATRGAVLRLVLRDALTLAVTGCVIGLVVASFVTSPLSMFLVPGLRPSDPASFIGTTMLLLVVSVGAAWLPARRALRVDPIASLRSE